MARFGDVDDVAWAPSTSRSEEAKFVDRPRLLGPERRLAQEPVGVRRRQSSRSAGFPIPGSRRVRAFRNLLVDRSTTSCRSGTASQSALKPQ
jgi:hypothetical protein